MTRAFISLFYLSRSTFHILGHVVSITHTQGGWSFTSVTELSLDFYFYLKHISHKICNKKSKNLLLSLNDVLLRTYIQSNYFVLHSYWLIISSAISDQLRDWILENVHGKNLRAWPQREGVIHWLCSTKNCKLIFLMWPLAITQQTMWSTIGD